jgi:hypothetical protein
MAHTPLESATVGMSRTGVFGDLTGPEVSRLRMLDDRGRPFRALALGRLAPTRSRARVVVQD